jgi:hypothetical protein
MVPSREGGGFDATQRNPMRETQPSKPPPFCLADMLELALASPAHPGPRLVQALPADFLASAES